MARVGVLEGPRTLSMSIPSYSGAYQTVAGGGTYDGWITRGNAANKQMGEGWTAVPSTFSLMYETYVDLSGYELDNLTFFPAEAGFQDPGLYNVLTSTGSAATDSLWVMDLMSQERLDKETLSKMLTDSLNEFNNAPGMMGSPVDYDLITMGNLRVMGNSLQVSAATNTPFIVQSASAFGSGSPVVVQKLWCYRFLYYPADAAGATMKIPASRFVLSGTAAKEKDLIYMQRLKNSYENQGSL